jgi:PiT family inorganic phosphate transporter
MLESTLLLAAVILFALTFDFVNGFHDAANAIATTVSTRALSPYQAIFLARTLNFVGALAGTAVAYTIGKGVVAIQPGQEGLVVLTAALIGAIGWDLITWYFGLPSSSTHALIGGLLGAGISAGGLGVLVLKGLKKVFLAMIISPVAGFLGGLLFIVIIFWLFRKGAPEKTNRFFKGAQILSAAWMSFSHGLNDAQNAMGMITIGLVAYGLLPKFQVPLWVKMASAVAMGIGTSIGGWKIIKTMGMKVTKLQPVHGFAAETSAGLVIYIMSLFGAPISTTHVISTSIMGVGASSKFSAVRWGIVRNIVWAWILTIPGAAFIGMAAFFILQRIF